MEYLLRLDEFCGFKTEISLRLPSMVISVSNGTCDAIFVAIDEAQVRDHSRGDPWLKNCQSPIVCHPRILKEKC